MSVTSFRDRVALVPEGFEVCKPHEVIRAGYLVWDDVERAWLPGNNDDMDYTPAWVADNVLHNGGDTLRWANCVYPSAA